MEQEEKAKIQFYMNALQERILKLFRANLNHNFKLEEIAFILVGNEKDIFDSYSFQKYLMSGYGLKGTIMRLIHRIQKDGVWLLSSATKGNGYSMPSTLDKDFLRISEIWNSALNSVEIRVRIVEEEMKNLLKILENYSLNAEPKIKEMGIELRKKLL